jgi:hypothetical protein
VITRKTRRKTRGQTASYSPANALQGREHAPRL